MKTFKKLLLSVTILSGGLLGTTWGHEFKGKNFCHLNPLAMPYFWGIKTYAKVCKHSCMNLYDTVEDKIAKLNQFIEKCNEDSTNCDKNTLDQIVGINTCFLQSLQNNSQNELKGFAEGEFDDMWTHGMMGFKFSCGIGNIVKQLKKYVLDTLSGHYQQIWQEIFNDSAIYDSVGVSNGNEFCQLLRDTYNNNNDALTIAKKIKNILENFAQNLPELCINHTCEIALDKLIYTRDNFCHNYFVNLANNVRNWSANCNVEANTIITTGKTTNVEIEIRGNFLLKLKTDFFSKVDVNCIADYFCRNDICETTGNGNNCSLADLGNCCNNDLFTRVVQNYCSNNMEYPISFDGEISLCGKDGLIMRIKHNLMGKLNSICLLFGAANNSSGNAENGNENNHNEHHSGGQDNNSENSNNSNNGNSNPNNSSTNTNNNNGGSGNTSTSPTTTGTSTQPKILLWLEY